MTEFARTGPEPGGVELVIGPYTFVFDPDGEDPGEGSVSVFRALAPIPDQPPASEYAATLPGVTRREWEDFVRGATL